MKVIDLIDLIDQRIADAPAANHEENDYNAGYVAALVELRDEQLPEQEPEQRVTVAIAPVRYKGPNDTDASMFRTAATRLANGFDIGGSNLRDSIAELLRRTADALEAAA